MKKLVTFKIELEVWDEGEFDEQVARDAIVDAFFKAQDEGALTRIDDETTLFRGVRVTVAKVEEGAQL